MVPRSKSVLGMITTFDVSVTSNMEAVVGGGKGLSGWTGGVQVLERAANISNAMTLSA